MARVNLDTDKDHLVTPKHSDARGPVVRGKSIEIMQMNWKAGDSARPHQHAEEQAIYVVSGRMRMTVGAETCEIGPGEVSYHPSNVLHGARALTTIAMPELAKVASVSADALPSLVSASRL